MPRNGQEEAYKVAFVFGLPSACLSWGCFGGGSMSRLVYQPGPPNGRAMAEELWINMPKMDLCACNGLWA
jgi:hypothetical protein